MPAAAIAWKTRAATPGTPAMPEPVTSTSETPGRKVRPRAPLGDGGGAVVHQAAGVVGREAVAHADRDPLLARRLDGLRVQHLGAEEGELHRLLVAHLGEHGGARDQPRVGAVDAVDVGPDLQQLGVEGPGGDGGGVVRAAAAQEVDAAVGVAAEEARQHGDRGGLLAQGREGVAGGRPVGRGRQRRAAGADQRLGIEEPGVEAARREQAVRPGRRRPARRARRGGRGRRAGARGGGRSRAAGSPSPAPGRRGRPRPRRRGRRRARGAARSRISRWTEWKRASAGTTEPPAAACSAPRRRASVTPPTAETTTSSGPSGRLAGDDLRHAAHPLRVADGSATELQNSHRRILLGKCPASYKVPAFPDPGGTCVALTGGMPYNTPPLRGDPRFRLSRRSSGVEQLIRNQQVVGSNPTVGSIR